MATGGELHTHAKEIAGRKLATRVSTACECNVTSGWHCISSHEVPGLVLVNT